MPKIYDRSVGVVTALLLLAGMLWGCGPDVSKAVVVDVSQTADSPLKDPSPEVLEAIQKHGLLFVLKPGDQIDLNATLTSDLVEPVSVESVVLITAMPLWLHSSRSGLWLSTDGKTYRTFGDAMDGSIGFSMSVNPAGVQATLDVAGNLAP